MKKWHIFGVIGFLILIGILVFFRKHQGTESDKIEILRQEVTRTCAEAAKRIKTFKKKYPDSEEKQNDEALNSPEWKDAMGWQQACDTAEADLEQALPSEQKAP